MDTSKVTILLAALVALCTSQGFEEQGACTTPNGAGGACVNIRGCAPLLELLRTQRQRPDAADFLRRSVCGYDGLDPIVCCPGRGPPPNDNRPPPSGNPDFGSNNNRPPPSGNPDFGSNNNRPPPNGNGNPDFGSNNNNPSPNGDRNFDNNNNNNRPPSNGNGNPDFGGQLGVRAGELLYPDACGFSNISHPRVVGGNPAILGAWPWMVALGYRASPRSAAKTPRFLCGASLITTRHVLTAAHCVFNRNDLYFARLGEHDLQSDSDGAAPVDVLIKDRRIHPGYTSSSYVNDIALLTLERDVTPTPKIHPICLPLAPEARSRDLVGLKPFIAGWGAKNFSGPSSSVLLEAQIPVVNETFCRSAFQRFRTAVIDKRVLCAGYANGGKDACQGDSGGPFMLPDKTTYYQIGVVSYGYRCAEPGIPGVYTRVSYFLDWIIENIK